jgi:hypothetical protein
MLVLQGYGESSTEVCRAWSGPPAALTGLVAADRGGDHQAGDEVHLPGL